MNKRVVNYVISILVLLIAVSVVFGMSKRPGGRQGKNRSEKHAEQKIRYYTCGMHPSIKVKPEEYNRGSTQCPICNMDLVPIYEEIREDKEEESKNEILLYTCGMHPSIKVKPEEYNRGSTQCPICHMDLVPVYKETEDREANVVKLTSQDVALAGIATAVVRELPLFKEIRTVGTVAYDPKLRTAEEEYIQALNTYEKILRSGFEGAKERSGQILSAAEIKLELLGLNKEWIDGLRRTRTPHRNLILPDKNMWVYADIYDFESIWPRIGDDAEVVSQVDPSKVFKGKIRAIDPVVNEKTRTLRLKLLVKNHMNLLKPNMYVDVYLKNDRGKELAIPRDAVLDTGVRKVVYVDIGAGKYGLREVRVGPEMTALVDGMKKRYFPVISGVSEGEEVVIKANFLIDSQSQLTGPAAAAYGGALDKEEGSEDMPQGQQH